jgi:hypothetical protein
MLRKKIIRKVIRMFDRERKSILEGLLSLVKELPRHRKSTVSAKGKEKYRKRIWLLS